MEKISFSVRYMCVSYSSHLQIDCHLTFFSTVRGFALLVIIFSIKNGDRLTRGISSRDTILINLGNSVAVFSLFELVSERFLLGLLFQFAM